MSTSLAEQLKKLSVPQTSSLAKNDKKRVSLLFNPREAANLNRDTFYSIGLEGLEELINKNECFEEFRSTLFHISAKDFERSVQERNENTKLNKLIKQFMLYLSPYFMLHCSYKALEWLIFRYQIHEYNKEDILMLILPYHETNIFARTLQLLNLKENDEWCWLEPLQKPGIHLPKSTLYNHAASSTYFIKFVSRTTKMVAQKEMTAQIHYNFYCTTFTGALEFAVDIKENLITAIMPCLLQGLSSSISDYCAASYVILAKLLNKVTLSQKLLTRFVEKIACFNVYSLHVEAVMVLIILFQKQSQFTCLKNSINNLVDANWLPLVLQNLQQQNILINPFLKVFMGELINSGINTENDKSRIRSIQLLQLLILEKEIVGFLIR